MANFTGTISGLVPRGNPEEPKPKVRKRPSASTRECLFCGYEQSSRQRKGAFFHDEGKDGYYCQGCTTVFGLITDTFFGESVFGMDSPMSPDQAKKKLEMCEVGDWAICLKSMKFAGVSTGRGINMDFGDAFRISRVGKQVTGDGTSECSRSKATVDVQFASETVTLFCHEFAPVKMIEMIQYKGTGEYSEEFLESNDDWGYFRPSEETRELLIETFGNR